MLVRIAVADPLPVFRRGVMEILREAGYETEAPDDLLAWVRDEQTRAVVITVGCDADWHLLEALNRSPAEVIVVALLDQMSVAGSVRAFRAGAACVMARDTSPSALREAFGAAVRGQSLMPVKVLRALIDSVAEEPSADERRWLRELAQGTTVGRLASEVGYSERMMFRLLRDLYTRLGADNRTEALVRAQAQGWL
jgi:DNA-binding NarL/FixJ family response regulator